MITDPLSNAIGISSKGNFWPLAHKNPLETEQDIFPKQNMFTIPSFRRESCERCARQEGEGEERLNWHMGETSL